MVGCCGSAACCTGAATAGPAAYVVHPGAVSLGGRRSRGSLGIKERGQGMPGRLGGAGAVGQIDLIGIVH